MSYLTQFTLLAATAAFAGCVTPAKAPSTPPASKTVATSPAPPRADATATSGTAAATWPPAAPREVKTRHALFKTARFDELPGWAGDDLANAWDAFRASCNALDRRESWRPVCESFDKLPRRPAEMRRFFEREFTLLQILNTDASRDGEVTGYYEPLIAGSTQPEGRYTVPVYGTPNDLFTIDWKTIPAAQRRAVVHVVAKGRELAVVPSPRAGSARLDTSQFELDTRDRRWRVRVDGGVARPYATRDEIEATSPLDAPVIAWVDDALALYAMQVQGSGRIQLRDGRVLRVQYAEQNGHPFKPLRLARAKPRGASRGLSADGTQPDSFELADAPASHRDDEAAQGDPGVVRIASRGMKPKTGVSGGAPATASDGLVDELLSGTARPAASARKPAPSSAAPRPAAPPSPRAQLLRNDPSYVFFRVAPDQSPQQGPIGALGVPLTAGRSIAVDPRVTPMGYPVYLSSPMAAGAAKPLQRLVIAQDTGGAIRGALRADFFWGFGADAGRQALQTRQRGQMWLLLPRAEANSLFERGLAMRSLSRGASAGLGECIVADAAFCSEPD